MVRKGDTPPKRKYTAQEKGKRKLEDSPKSAPPRTRSRLQTGIRIQEPQTPQSASPQTRVTSPSAPLSPSGMDIPLSSRTRAFHSKEEEDEYISRFSQRNFTKGKTVDYTFFVREGFMFVHWLKDYGLTQFMLKDELVYDDLVRLFYFHFKNQGRQFFTYLRGKEITFNEEELANILKVPYFQDDEDDEEDEEDEEDQVNLTEAILFFTGNEALSRTQMTFTNRKFLNVDFKLLHSVISHCLFPKGGGFDTVTIDDVKLMWCIVKQVKYHLITEMLTYMIGQKRRTNGYLPYAMYLTRFFKHFEIPLKDLKPQKVTTYDSIGISTLRRMRYRFYGGKWLLQSEIQDLEHPQEQQGDNDNADKVIDLTDSGAQADGERVGGMKDETLEGDADLRPPSPFHYTEDPNPFSPSNQPLSEPVATPTVPTSSSTQHFTSQQIGNLSQAQTISIDFSSLQQFMESNFSLLTSKIGSIETRLDTLGSEVKALKSDTSSVISELQDRVESVVSTIVTVTPQLRTSLSSMQQQLDFTTSTVLEDNKNLGATMRDLRDNADRICLSAGLPSLNSLLSELAKANRKREEDAYPFKDDPHFQRSKPTKFKPPNPAKKSKQTKAKKSKPVHISDDESDNFTFPKGEQDPYEDRPEE